MCCITSAHCSCEPVSCCREVPGEKHHGQQGSARLSQAWGRNLGAARVRFYLGLLIPFSSSLLEQCMLWLAGHRGSLSSK